MSPSRSKNPRLFPTQRPKRRNSTPEINRYPPLLENTQHLMAHLISGEPTGTQKHRQSWSFPSLVILDRHFIMIFLSFLSYTENLYNSIIYAIK